jgi:hypothetical protein
MYSPSHRSSWSCDLPSVVVGYGSRGRTSGVAHKIRSVEYRGPDLLVRCKLDGVNDRRA